MRGDGLAAWDRKIQTIIYRTDKQKVLRYSTGNYIQYPLINHNGKEHEKDYICITQSLCHTAEIKHSIVNQLYFNNLKKKWVSPSIYSKS